MSSSPPPAGGTPGGPPSRPSDQVSPRTLRGTVNEVAGSVVIESQFGRWALVGRLPPGLAPGTRVEITARPQPQAESPCGSPVLAVLALTRL